MSTVEVHHLLDVAIMPRVPDCSKIDAQVTGVSLVPNPAKVVQAYSIAMYNFDTRQVRNLF